MELFSRNHSPQLEHSSQKTKLKKEKEKKRKKEGTKQK